LFAGQPHYTKLTGNPIDAVDGMVGDVVSQAVPTNNNVDMRLEATGGNVRLAKRSGEGVGMIYTRTVKFSEVQKSWKYIKSTRL
jgi:hypothetical protein